MKKEKEGELEGWKRAEKKKRREGKKEGREESDLVNCYQLLSPLNRFLLF